MKQTYEYKNNFVLGVLNGVLFNIAEAMIGGTTVLPIFISKVTSSKVLIGLSGTMGNAGWFMPQLLVANLIEHLRYKKPVYVWSGVVRIVSIWAIALLVAILGRIEAGLFVAAFFVLYSAYSLGAGVAGIPFMDVVAKTVPAERRGTFFGARMFFGGISGALTGVYVKGVLATRPFPASFTILFVTASAIVTAAILSFCFVTEPKGPTPEARIPFRQFLLRGPVILKNVRSYRLLLVVRVLLGVWGMPLPFYIIYAQEKFDIAPGAVGVFLTVQMVGQFVSNVLWGFLSNRIGNRIVLVSVSALAIASPLITLATTVSVPLSPAFCLGIVFFFLGCSLSGMSLGHNNYMLDVSPPSERPTYLGFMNTFLSPVLLLSALGGLMIERASYEALFLTATGAGVLALIFAIQLEEPRARPTAA